MVGLATMHERSNRRDKFYRAAMCTWNLNDKGSNAVEAAAFAEEMLRLADEASCDEVDSLAKQGHRL